MRLLVRLQVRHLVEQRRRPQAVEVDHPQLLKAD
jgi:hypothetical protein